MRTLLLTLVLITLRVPMSSKDTFDDSDLPPDPTEIKTYTCSVFGPVSERMVVQHGVLQFEENSWNVKATVVYKDDKRRDWEKLIAVHTKQGKKIDISKEREFAEHHYCDPWMKKVHAAAMVKAK